MRVDAVGRLARTPHPSAFGAALTHPYLTTDYSEALLEFVTPPRTTNWQTLQFLCDLHIYVHHRSADELLWPASMPCVLDPEHEIPIADYGPSNQGMVKTVYRRGLGFRYGRAMQAIAGVHVNYSPPLALWEPYRDRERSPLTVVEFKSAELMGLVRNYRRAAWLATYLFGASPALCKSFRPDGDELLSELDSGTWHAPYATSLRMSRLGYRNRSQARLNISANSLADYVGGLAAALTTPEPRYEAIGVEVDGEYRQLSANILQIENEYYSPIRPKPAKTDSRRVTVALREGGVEYVEIRTLDVNLADPVGVNQAELRFLEALLLTCLLEESPPLDPKEQDEIEARDLLVASEGRRPGLRLPSGGRMRPLTELGIERLERVAEVAELLDADGEGYLAAVEVARTLLREPEATPSARLLQELRREQLGFFQYVRSLARRHREYFLALDLEAETERELTALAERSLAESRRLSDGERPPFGEYVRRWLGAT